MEDALDEEVIDEGAGGLACEWATAVVAGVVDDIVDEDDDDGDWKRCSVLFCPDCRSIFSVLLFSYCYFCPLIFTSWKFFWGKNRENMK